MTFAGSFAARLASIGLAAGLLAACASAPPPPPDPLELLRAWQVYVYGAGDTLVGRSSVPEHPADRDKPVHVLPSVVRAFCRPVNAGEAAAVADEAINGFCRSAAATDPTARVVLSPGWKDPAPPYRNCFIRCVCEGYAPRLDDPVDQGRESESGPCTNRLNCRLECPAH
ncbi:MAG TPA: hypothetical protein VMQ62_10870 [Dongiaceae bacterium]|nr:hypothetical protein [Dongiaceae bacterium]